ncbi:MAG TPA: hypothetical protein VGT40_20790 [Methylomirabilota bacterium]|jgi:hypothetical protein|nr:hypothetical protein [Methylomirabilota bacterium]
MTQTPRKQCWCRNGAPPVEIPTNELANAGIPEEVLVKHRRFWKCRAYCDIVSTVEGGQRIALGYLTGEKWTAVNPEWHRPLPIPVPRPKRGGGGRSTERR